MKSMDEMLKDGSMGGGPESPEDQMKMMMKMMI